MSDVVNAELLQQLDRLDTLAKAPVPSSTKAGEYWLATNPTDVLRFTASVREAIKSRLQAEAPEDAEVLREVMLALEDLSFECFSPIAPCNPPSVATYSRTFDVLDRHRKARGWATVPKTAISKPRTSQAEAQAPAVTLDVPMIAAGYLDKWSKDIAEAHARKGAASESLAALIALIRRLIPTTAPAPVDATTAAQSSVAPVDQLREIASLIDVAMGDTDPQNEDDPLLRASQKLWAIIETVGAPAPAPTMPTREQRLEKALLDLLDIAECWETVTGGKQFRLEDSDTVTRARALFAKGDTP